MKHSILNQFSGNGVGGSLSVACLLLIVNLVSSSIAADPVAVDFNRDVRPILSDHCFECHGPDAEQRQADLRLDTKDGLFRKSDDHHTITAGKAEQSELFRRIASTDSDVKMPPPDTGRKLTPEQIAIIRKWIDSGADWQQHWSFIPPVKAKTPTVSQPEWVKNPVDAFVLARLDKEGLTPAAPADRRTLLRRVSFDLTGLPPTPGELHAFINDDSPDAYERVVDRLLKSPRYAERMAIRWLDASRYADTNGYQSDGPRYMWRWRDWVLEAFHQNMPFDQFTIEQLAGDLLPDPTLDQQIATGFNRNHRGNAEGGIVPEEYQVEYVVDRVDTTFTVWQGLTMGCARCHSHKFDPLSQKEYYQVFACFNNIPENGRALKEGNSPPYIKAPTPEQQSHRKELFSAWADADREWAELEAQSWIALDHWRDGGWKDADDSSFDTWDITEGLILKAEMDSQSELAAVTVLDAKPQDEPLDGESRETPALRGTARFQKGMSEQAIHLDGDGFVEIPGVGDFGYFDRFSIGAFVRLPQHKAGTIVSRMELVEKGPGYSLDVTDDGKVQLNLVRRWLDDSLRVETRMALPVDKWVHVLATYDGLRTSKAIQIYIDGIPVRHKANLDGINQSFATDQPVRIGAGNSKFHGLIDDVRIYDRVLDEFEAMSIAEPRSIRDLLSLPKEQLQLPKSGRSMLAYQKFFFHFMNHAGPKKIVDAFHNVRSTTHRLREFDRSLPTVMVMQEIETPRETHVLQRGQYDRPGERVEFGVPSSLPPLPEAAPSNRLGLARWLVSRDNPLTARVTVNRFWRDIFGTGIVKTTEDFGVQGERPTHPELLDWLAVEFMESGWDVKHLMKTIVMSNTYQQSSQRHKSEGRGLKGDPDNRLLARGPRARLSAEMIRDQALFVSGLLTEKLGGPSVRPYQPEGLLKEIASDTKYEQDHGPNLYRRSLYTYWKRTVAPPMMTNFDAAGREACEVRQSRTNTPLQALNLLNDVTFVEAARVLAQKVLATPRSDEQRLNRVFERLLSRLPSDRERSILLAGLNHHRERFIKEPAAAKALIDAGEWAVAKRLAPHELAAWATICSTILNLDEAVTKE